MVERRVGSVSDRRQSHAVEAFERAVKALGKKDFEKALGLLDALIEAHPEERELLERARSYRAICTRALEKKPSFRPKTFEDLLTYGVFLHNRGEYAEAIKYLQQAAEIHPRNEHVLYCLATAHARSGDAVATVKALRAAISTNPVNRAQARSDSDFDPVREDAEFVALVHSA